MGERDRAGIGGARRVRRALATASVTLLVAAAAAGHVGGPVLLVQHDSIPAPTRRALDDPPKRHDWLVGGTAVIGGDVFDALP